MMLPPSIQVCPVELPGRGRRQSDTPINDVVEIAEMLARTLPLEVPGPSGLKLLGFSSSFLSAETAFGVPVL